VRRSTLDVALGRRLEIGQSWRDRVDGLAWRVQNVHRGDCHVDLVAPDGARRSIPFAVLRGTFDQLVPADKEVR
jgi:hypothetical protein